MKAQTWRKLLGLTNAALVLGIVGGGAWWFTQVRPAAAESAKPPKWTKESYDAYQAGAKTARAREIWPVDAEAIKQITVPDTLMNPVEKGGPYVWPYIGPVPPPKKVIEPTKVVEGPPAPSGLEVIGKPTMVYSVAEGPVVVTWLFTNPPSKNAVTIERGQFFVPDADKSKGRFKLIDGWRVPPSLASQERAVEIVYEVYDEKTGKLERLEHKAFTLASDAPKVSMTPLGAGGADATPGKTPDGRPIPPDDGKAPKVAEVKIFVKETSPGVRTVEFDEIAWRWGTRTDMNQILDEVKTKDVVDAQGRKAGVEISGINPGSVPSQFDVKPGDILKSINGTPVHDRAEAVDVVKKLPKDVTVVQVVIERNGRQIVYNVDARDPKVRAAAGKVRYDNRK